MNIPAKSTSLYKGNKSISRNAIVQGWVNLQLILRILGTPGTMPRTVVLTPGLESDEMH